MSWLIYLVGIAVVFGGATWLENKYGNKARKVFQEEERKVVNK